MIKKILNIIVITISIFLLASCDETSNFKEDEIKESIQIFYAEGNEQTYVTHNIELPMAIYLDEDVTIEWYSLNPNVISENGLVTRQDSDTQVVLTYHVKYKDLNIYENIILTVIGLNDSSVYKVTFDTDGGTLIDDIFVYEGEKITQPEDPVKDNYVFLGWYETNTYLRSFNFDAMPSGDVTIYAKWQYVDPVVYTLTFDSNGGTQVSPISANGGSKIDAPDSPSKEGYDFVGWYSDPDLVYAFDVEYMTYGDFTVYAKWVEAIDFKGYYEDINGLYGDDLITELNFLLNDTGYYSTVTYGDVRDILEESDVLTTDTSKLDLIYSTTTEEGAYAKASWDSGATWNREHVWAKSLLGDGYDTNNSTRGIAADAHNLRAADSGINSSRGNKLFSSSKELLGTYGDDGTGKWYPGDAYIGDVARIILYMDIRWGDETSISAIGNLDTFITWHLLDPVDDFEINRNNIIYSYQGNRNPFIDYPELVERLYVM